MSETRIIRYRTTPETADDNARLIAAVFAELAERDVRGLRYTAFRLDDGVSFVHVATLEGADNPLASLSSFAAFQAGIVERCVEGPLPAVATVVGSYGDGPPR